MVGAECALRLGRPFVDTDDLVESEAEASVVEIFATEGEGGFRDRERRAVADACEAPEPSVIACGGGVVVDPENRRRLRDAGVVVWLSAPPDVLAQRVGGADDRPLLTGAAPAATLARLLAQRRGAYAEVAHVVVNTAGRSVDDLADEVVGFFNSFDDAEVQR